MREDTASVVELVTAFRQGTLDLAGVLAALSRHPAVAEADYRTGVDTLWQMREEQAIDEAAMTTLLEHLQALRARAVDASPGGDDITVVKPAQLADLDTPTRLHPATDTVDTHTLGSATRSQSASLATWERVAAAEGQCVTVGSVLKGRFLLERELGRGGMGVVYLARDARKVEARDRDPWLAVKVLSDEFRRHPDSLVALQREARRSQQLGHENIVRVYDFDKDDGIVFMTMEYVQGNDLRTLIREQAFSGMPLARAWPLIQGMGNALRRAHATGIVHSDFKPGNVMVTADGVPKVFDFGIARAGKHKGDAAGEQTVFDAASLGALTPAYASLEMLRGQAPTPADDVYALGCVCFELLCGRHPFDKASAEVAQREGRQPPPLPGLSKRQYRTLRAAVALEARHRLQNVDALLEGLRALGWRERLLPRLGYATTAVAIAGVAAVGIGRHLQTQRLADVTARFQADAAQPYADEQQAWQGLASLDETQRARLLTERSDLVEGFLLRRLQALWQPAQGRYDFPGTAQVFALRDRLRLYSPALDEQRQRIDAERDQQLNTLDTRLGTLLQSGDLFGEDRGGVQQTLATVRAIDPGSALLRHPELEVAFAEAIDASVAVGDSAHARAQLRTAQALFPDALRLKLQAAQLGDETPLRAARLPADAAAADAALQRLLAQPVAAAEWRAAVTAALQAVQQHQPDRWLAARARVAAAIAATLAAHDTPAQVPDDLVLLDFGLQQTPDAPALLAQRTRLQQRQHAMLAALDADRADAEQAARSESLRRAVAAGDLDKAGQMLVRLRALDSDDAFVRDQAPQLLEQAFQRRANGLVERGDFAAAAAQLAAATPLLGARPALEAARTRYEVVGAVLAAARSGTLTGTPREDLRQQLERLYRSDARALQQLEQALQARGQLRAESLRALLQQHGASAVPVVPPVTASTAPATAAAPATRPRPAAPSTATPSTGNGDEALPPVPEGPDPCDGLAGRARTCFDALGDARGPMLVVVPGIDGGKPFALSRGEIAVDDLNRYCQATGRCGARAVGSAEQGRLPAQGVSLAQARDYARWLTRASGGWRYRLPTDAEWVHAAQAGRQWRQAPDSNCIPPTASAGSGGAPVGVRGREANPWGLVNLSGNVWEWVGQGSGALLRGGSYASFWSECTVQARREAPAGAGQDVGLRVLRELK